MGTIVFDDDLTARVTRRAEEAGETMQSFVENTIRGMVDHNFGYREGIPFFRPEPGEPIQRLTIEEIHRLAWGDGSG